jgi:helicase MOV-10
MARKMASGASTNVRDSGKPAGTNNPKLVPAQGLPPNPTRRPRTARSLTSSKKSAATNAKNIQDAERSSTEAEPEYDVYAPPFVPSTLRSINTDKSRIVFTKPKHQIEFDSYAHTFAATSFLPTSNWKVIYENYKRTVLPWLPLNEHSYSQYFSWLMRLELAAKREMQEAYELYQVPLPPFHTPETALWILSVPGLREDSPHVEMGDTLQLRQLWVDGVGALITVPIYAGAQDTGYSGYPPVIYKFWSEVQYDAVVYSVNHAQEIV